MAKQARSVVVSQKTAISKNMVRLTLSGDDLSGFPTGFEGGYVKMVLDASEKPPMRSYTVRRFDARLKELDLEVVSHGDSGPGARWINSARVGDDATIVGPGPCQPINLDADWFLLAGDMSAFPAISVNLDRLPNDARGYLVLEVLDEKDKQSLELPDTMDVIWIVNSDPDSADTQLEECVRQLPWLDGQVAVWAAGEFGAARALRQYFRHERAVPREYMYVSSYWKIGDTDEGMKAAKKADPEPW